MRKILLFVGILVITSTALIPNAGNLWFLRKKNEVFQEATSIITQADFSKQIPYIVSNTTQINEVYNGTCTPSLRLEKTYSKFLKWNYYAKTWREFCVKYKYIKFGDSSKMRVYNKDFSDANKHIYELKPINFIQTLAVTRDENKKFNYIKTEFDGGLFNVAVRLEGWLNFWIDDEYLHWRYTFQIESWYSRVSSYVNLAIYRMFFTSEFWGDGN